MTKKEHNLMNIKITKLGGSLELCLNDWQMSRVNQFIGCVRRVKNNKIAEINNHNEQYLNNFKLFSEFKEKHPDISNNENPYKYVYPNQQYSLAKNSVVDFIGPLNKDQYDNMYKFNKHYLERTPSEFYRNSMKELLDGNNKYIKDFFNKNLAYHIKRKPLRFIKKSDYTGSLLATKSDNLFTIKENQICFGRHFDKSYPIEQEIKVLNKQLKNKKLSIDEKFQLEHKILELNIKLEKDISYLGILKTYKPKKNKTSKEIDYSSINSIRIKKNKNRYYITFTFDYVSEYKPSLFKDNVKSLDNEIISKEELALYIKQLTDILGKEAALDYLQGKILGVDRGINERLALSINEKSFMSYEPEIKAYIEKLKRQIDYHNKQLKRRTKGSRGYNKSLSKFRKLHKKVADIKSNINHQVTHEIVNDYDYPIIAIEKLNIKGMTKRAMPKVDIKKSLELGHNIKSGLDELKLKSIIERLEEYYKSNINNIKYKDIAGDYKLHFAKNNSAQKSGLNESILNQNWGQFSEYLGYKSEMTGKIMIEVAAHYSSQECSQCGYVDAKNRIKTKFCCLKCNYKEHADTNASRVIASRVYETLIKYITELNKKELAKAKKSSSVVLRMEHGETSQQMVEKCQQEELSSQVCKNYNSLLLSNKEL